MIIAGFIAGIFILSLCGVSEKNLNEKIMDMSVNEYHEYNKTGKLPERML